MFQLRPYQAEAKQAILNAWDEGYRKTLLVLPTGCGKTVVFSSVAEEQVGKGRRVLIMAHRGELLDQAADKLRQASGIESVLEKAESSCFGSDKPVTVGSVQSLAQPKRLARFPRDYFQDVTPRSRRSAGRSAANGKRRYTTMTINEAMKKLRLPNPANPEDLECNWSKTLTFGDKVLVAGYYYSGKNKPCWFGATYEFLGGDRTCEGTVGLRAVSEVKFEDDGHAIAWAMRQ